MNNDESILMRNIIDMLVNGAPNIKRQSTGALRNSIKEAQNGIEIGGQSGGTMVDYAPYTDLKWEHPRWHGKQNPNEGWINRLAIQGIRIFAQRMGYKVVE